VFGFEGQGPVVQETATPGRDAKPKYSIKFSVIGLDYNHIMSITAAMQRGGELVSVYSTKPKNMADFQQRFGAVKAARSEDEILNDPSIQLVAAAPVPDKRAAGHSRHAARPGLFVRQAGYHPPGAAFVGDIVNRTHVAQDQALLATELALKVQKNGQMLHFSS
jgi:hypothetical protein